MDATVTVTTDEAVSTILIDRAAKLNALTPELLDSLRGALAEVARGDSRVVVLRTAGDRAFCVGADINRFSALGPVAMWNSWTAQGHDVFTALANLPQPTVALLQGDAYGGGLELALAADFRIANPGVRLGLPEVGLGTVPGWAGTERLTRLIGPARASEVVLARRLLEARTALEWGVVTEVAEIGGLDAACAALVAQLCGGAPIAVRLGKQLIRAAAAGVPSIYIEPLAGALAATTTDLSEGVEAFRARRPAAFTGH